MPGLCALRGLRAVGPTGPSSHLESRSHLSLSPPWAPACPALCSSSRCSHPLQRLLDISGLALFLPKKGALPLPQSCYCISCDSLLPEDTWAVAQRPGAPAAAGVLAGGSCVSHTRSPIRGLRSQGRKPTCSLVSVTLTEREDVTVTCSRSQSRRHRQLGLASQFSSPSCGVEGARKRHSSYFSCLPAVYLWEADREQQLSLQTHEPARLGSRGRGCWRTWWCQVVLLSLYPDPRTNSL